MNNLEKILLIPVTGTVIIALASSNSDAQQIPDSTLIKGKYDAVLVKDGQLLSHSPTVLPLTNTLQSIDDALYKSSSGLLPPPFGLPFEVKGFVDPGDITMPIDSVFAYARSDSSLLSKTPIALADTVIAPGDTAWGIPNFYDIQIFTTNGVVPGGNPSIGTAAKGDTLEFYAKLRDGSVVPLLPKDGSLPIHNPGGVHREDFKMDIVTSVVDPYLDPQPMVPQKFELRQNYPNPFNPSTTVDYDIRQAGLVKVQIYNIKGDVVRTLYNQFMVPGSYTQKWDGRNKYGVDVASGQYYFLLTHIGGRGSQEVKAIRMLKIK